MRRLRRLLAALITLFGAATPQSAWCWPQNSQLAERSSTSVAIRASVLPSFHVIATGRAGSLLLANNAQALRYTLAVSSLSGTHQMPPFLAGLTVGNVAIPTRDEAKPPSSAQSVFILIIPD